MDAFDPAGEWLRISEHYRQMNDGELLLLARQRSELTDFAQQALKGEMRSRGLTLEPEESPSSPIPEPPPDGSGDDSPYADDRKLVELCTVWSVRDALQLQSILDGAEIPFFIGPEKATGVDRVRSNLTNGLLVQIMQIGMPWAMSAMRHYEPEDDPTPKHDENAEHPVLCPKCRSTEIVFDQLILDPTTRDRTTQDPLAEEPPIDESATAPLSAPIFKWTCDTCGHVWQDDGIVREG